MKKKPFVVVGLLAFVLVVVVGFTTAVTRLSNVDSDTQKEKELNVVTSFYSVYIAAENIIGDAQGVKLTNLSEPQTGCLHDYQLTTADMKLISTADVFIVNGGGIENFLTDVAKEYPALSIVDASQNLALIQEEDEENAHAWMSVPLYRKQVAAIAESLCELDPSRKEIYTANAKAYDEKLAELEDEQDEIREAAQGQNVIIFHEAYAYVAQDYGVNVSYVLDLDEERQVSAGEVADVLGQIKENGVQFIFAEERYGSDMGNTVMKESDVQVIYLDTCNRGNYDKDSYLLAMQSNIDQLKEAFCK